MSFHETLREILQISGVDAVIFLDAEGETVLLSGSQDPDRLKALGAYQSILLKTAWGEGKCQTLCSVYDQASVLTHHMKDGYFISVILSPELPFSLAHQRLGPFYEKIEEEL
jgi:hypothetical protein